MLPTRRDRSKNVGWVDDRKPNISEGLLGFTLRSTQQTLNVPTTGIGKIGAKFARIYIATASSNDIILQ